MINPMEFMDQVQQGNVLFLEKGACIILQGQELVGLPSTANLASQRQQSRLQLEALAMEAVMEAEKKAGYEPKDVSSLNCGYDIEAYDPKAGSLRLLEVKGRAAFAKTVTLTRNEVVTGLANAQRWLLALVLFERSGDFSIRYLECPFQVALDPVIRSVTCELGPLWKLAKAPPAPKPVGVAPTRRTVRFSLLSGRRA